MCQAENKTRGAMGVYYRVLCQLTIALRWRLATAIIINISLINDALALLGSLKPGESINYT